jgi:hypothetical protein
MESIGKFSRPPQGDAVTAIDLVGGDSQPFCDNPAQPLDGKEAAVATHQHPHRNVRPPLQGRGFVHARFALAPPARQASMSASFRRLSGGQFFMGMRSARFHGHGRESDVREQHIYAPSA